MSIVILIVISLVSYLSSAIYFLSNGSAMGAFGVFWLTALVMSLTFVAIVCIRPAILSVRFQGSLEKSKRLICCSIFRSKITE